MYVVKIWEGRINFKYLKMNKKHSDVINFIFYVDILNKCFLIFMALVYVNIVRFILCRYIFTVSILSNQILQSASYELSKNRMHFYVKTELWYIYIGNM